MNRTLIVPFAALLASFAFGGASVSAKSGAAKLPPGKVIVFLGDSITQDGRYVEMLDAALVAQSPDDVRTVIPLGLASETVSGLSEPGHAGGQFPRPDLHERLERVLQKARPDLVVACYGMNDGIYHPLDAERTRAFQDGMTRLHQKVVASGARIIHVTPPVFDPLPIKERLLPAGQAAYPQPYEGYNQVLDAYSEWLLRMRREKQWEVIDLHGPMNRRIAEQRKIEPKFTFSRDGVHPGPEGHAFIASVIAEAWGLKLRPEGTPDHPQGSAILQAIRRKHGVLRPAWLSHVGHQRPGIAPGRPLEDAAKQAVPHDAEARRLSRER